ncbi:MAG: hypothetical protein R2796_12150 [Chitinophagaceae bacterium]
MLQKWNVGEAKYLLLPQWKEFDFPYLCRRIVINHITIPGMPEYCR